MSWKVTDDVIQHIAVKEVGKENAFSLGQTLMIGESEWTGERLSLSSAVTVSPT